MLQLERISVAYGKHEALHEISIDVAPARTTVILGANGAGKTTLLKTVAGLVRPRPGGRILFAGRPIENEAPHRIVAAGVALVPEGRRLFGEMTVIENLRLGAYTEHARANEAVQLEKQLALFPRLAERRNQLAKTMSGGEQQMLAIARALMSQPKVILLDEPSLGLSPRLVKDLFSIIRRITEGGQSVVLVEQNAHQSLQLADYVYVLENGRIHSSGTPQSILEDQAIQQAYLGSGRVAAVTVAPAAPTMPPTFIPPATLEAELRNSEACAAPVDPALTSERGAANGSLPPVGPIDRAGGFVNPFARSVSPNQPDRTHGRRDAPMTDSPQGTDRPAPPPVETIARTGGFVNPYARSVEPQQAKAAKPAPVEEAKPTSTSEPQPAPAPEKIERTGGFVNPHARSV